MKMIETIFIFIFILVLVSVNSVALDLSPSPTYRYRLNGSSGSGVDDSADDLDIIHLLGNGGQGGSDKYINGTIVEGNQSYNFDGDAVLGYSIGTTNLFSTTYTALTSCFWTNVTTRPTGTRNFNFLGLKANSGKHISFGIGIKGIVSDGLDTVNISFYTNTDGAYNAQSSNLSDSNFFNRNKFVCFSFSDNSESHFFLDGIEMTKILNNIFSMPLGRDGKFYIGSSIQDDGNVKANTWYEGIVDDIAIWNNTNLSSSQILSIYQSYNISSISNATPSLTINTPLNNSQTHNATPFINFTISDLESDNISYNIYLDHLVNPTTLINFTNNNNTKQGNFTFNLWTILNNTGGSINNTYYLKINGTDNASRFFEQLFSFNLTNDINQYNTTNVTITPLPLNANTQAQCHYNLTNYPNILNSFPNQSDNISMFNIRWRSNGTLIPEAENNTLLNAPNMSLNANISCEVRINNGFGDNGWTPFEPSSNISVGDLTAPEILNVSLQHSFMNTTDTNIFTMKCEDSTSNLKRINFTLRFNQSTINYTRFIDIPSGLIGGCQGQCFQASPIIEIGQKSYIFNYTLFGGSETAKEGYWNITTTGCSDTSTNYISNNSNNNFVGFDFLMDSPPLINSRSPSNNGTVTSISTTGNAVITETNPSFMQVYHNITGIFSLNQTINYSGDGTTQNIFNLTDMTDGMTYAYAIHLNTSFGIWTNSSNFTFTISISSGGSPSGGGGGGGSSLVQTIIEKVNITKIENCNQDLRCDKSKGEDPFSCPTDCKVNVDYLTCDNPLQPCIKDTIKNIFTSRNPVFRLSLIIGAVSLGILFYPKIKYRRKT